jgi:hypothetical protein
MMWSRRHFLWGRYPLFRTVNCERPWRRGESNPCFVGAGEGTPVQFPRRRACVFAPFGINGHRTLTERRPVRFFSG